MTEYPDPNEVDRRLHLRIQLWVGAGAVVLGLIVIIANLLAGDGRIPLLTLVGMVVGAPMAVVAWRRLRCVESAD